MNFIKNSIKTVITYAIWGLVSCPILLFFCFPMIFLPKPFRYNNRLYFFFTSLLCRIALWGSFLKITIKGKENLPEYPDNPAIIIMNHASSLDIAVLEMLVGSYPHVWMSKGAYQKIPIFGLFLKRMHVAVERNSLSSARNSLNSMVALLENRPAHGLIFPEGTRYDDGQIHKFYQGFAVLAQKLKRPVIPVLSIGLNKVFPKKSWLINSSQNIIIIIGKPIMYPENATLEEFTTQVHQYFQETLSRAQ